MSSEFGRGLSQDSLVIVVTAPTSTAPKHNLYLDKKNKKTEAERQTVRRRHQSDG